MLGLSIGAALGTLFGFYQISKAEKAAEAAAAAAKNKADAAEPGQFNFQTPASEIMEKIVDLHHDLLFFIIVIVAFVS
jgi:hypothetical protein